jgi:hypothetical protein
MNQFFVVAIAEKISAMETAAFFERGAEQASKERAEKAWSKVGKNKASKEDQ